MSFVSNWSDRMLQLLRRMNNFYLPGSSRTTCLRFEVAGEEVGWVPFNVASILTRFSEVFKSPRDGAITLCQSLDSYSKRSEAVDAVLQALRKEGSLTCLKGWRDEAAGGLAAGISVKHTMVKECEEEARIPAAIAETARPVSTVSYTYEDEEGVFPECQFVFDLELPSEFQPRIGDGEVQDFYILSMDKVKGLLVCDEFKPNCAMVVLDFLIRHSYIQTDTEPYYQEFVAGLHQTL